MHLFIAQNHEKLSRKTAQVLRDELAYNIAEKERFIPGLATASAPFKGSYETL